MGFPKKVKVVDVGPRDGFQIIKNWIDTSVKKETCRLLLDAGVDMLEATSFVSPKAIPQMQDAADIVDAANSWGAKDKYWVLVPNKKGADRAVAAGAPALTVVISASYDHNMNNVRKTPEESLEELRMIREEYPNIPIKLDVGTAFGCPFKGKVSVEEVRLVIDGAVKAGVKEICLCDTVGVASPLLVKSLLEELLKTYEDDGIHWSLHLHNTRGMAVANTMVALELGIDCFETAIAGLGGCPFAPGASGNLATEDLLYLLEELGIESNVDIHKVIAASAYLVKEIQCCADSKINAVTVNRVFPKEGSAK